MVRQLLALDPTSSQLVAALDETVVKETVQKDSPVDDGLSPMITVPKEKNRPVYCSAYLDETLCERAREIDPRTGGSCDAFWGEWISLWERPVNRALCWYALPDQLDILPDWAMRHAWPEYADSWDELLEKAVARHQLARCPDEARDAAIPFGGGDLPL